MDHRRRAIRFESVTECGGIFWGRAYTQGVMCKAALTPLKGDGLAAGYSLATSPEHHGRHEAATQSSRKWEDGFDRRCLPGLIGNSPSVEAEANVRAALGADSNPASLAKITLRQTDRGSEHVCRRGLIERGRDRRDGGFCARCFIL